MSTRHASSVEGGSGLSRKRKVYTPDSNSDGADDMSHSEEDSSLLGHQVNFPVWSVSFRLDV